jgi:hypothetical protein
MARLAKRLSIFSGGIILSLFTALPAAAFVNCPPGYNYYYGYGCVPVSDGYNALYGDEYDYGPPVYDTYGLAFGFNGGRGGRGGGGFHGGGGRAGGGGGHASGGGGGRGGGGRR